MAIDSKETSGAAHRSGEGRQTALLDIYQGEAFDRVAQLAAKILTAPVAFIALDNGERVSVESAGGLSEGEATTHGLPLAEIVCRHTATSLEPLAIVDARTDPRIPESLWSSEPGFVACVGVPLVSRGGLYLGVIGVVDRQPRSWRQEEIEILRGLADSIVTEIELRAVARDAEQQAESRKRAEEERADLLARLGAAEARYRGLFENAADAILVADGEARYIDANQAATELLGYTRDELLQMGVPDVVQMPGWARAEYARFVGEGTWRGELELRRKDGSLVPVEARATTVELADEMVYVSIIRDITERKRAEESLRDEARMIETLHRIGAALVAELDLRKLVQAVTDAATELVGAQFGAFFYNRVNEEGEAYTLYTLSGAPREALSRFPMPRNTAVFGPTFRGGAVIRLDDVTRDARYGKNPPYCGMPQGHLPVRSYLAVPVISRSGEVLGGLFFGHAQPGVFREREERLSVGIAAQAAIAIDNARLYQEAQDAIRMRDVFLSVASHELKTPVAALQGYAELLLRRAENEKSMTPRDERALRTIYEQAIRLHRLIESLLDLSRIQSGRLSIESRPVDLWALADRVVAGVRPTLEQHTVELRASEKPLVVEGDELRLEQVLQNLLQNAIKYSPEGGTVTVRLERRGGQASIAVSDQGIGIPAEALPELFSPFYRTGRARLSRIEGVGLGLSVVKQIVTLHGGSVEVESVEGQGSTFTVSLPLLET